MKNVVFEQYNQLLSICSEISKLWQEDNYDSNVFYKSVLKSSQGANFSALADIENQMYLLEEPYVRRLQHPSTFSDFNFQIYNDGRFFVEILNWYSGHVNPHDHDFTAVQYQLKGKALNVLYDFEENERKGAITTGVRRIKDVVNWSTGGSSVVKFGDEDPHAVFHLNEPSTSLLIRTLPTPRAGFQNNYFPNFKAKYYVNDAAQRKKLTSLDLIRNDESSFSRMFWYYFENQSISENLFMMIKLSDILVSIRYSYILSKVSEISCDYFMVVKSVIKENAANKIKRLAHSLSDEQIDEKRELFTIASFGGSVDASYRKLLTNRYQNVQNYDSISNHVEVLMYE